METLAQILHFWNDWIVFPACLIAAIYFVVKFRKLSLAMVAAGIAIFLMMRLIEKLILPQYANSLPDSLYVLRILWISGSVSLILFICGSAWFFLRDYPAIRRQSNPLLSSDARQETPHAG